MGDVGSGFCYMLSYYAYFSATVFMRGRKKIPLSRTHCTRNIIKLTKSMKYAASKDVML